MKDLNDWKQCERPGNGPFVGRYARLERLDTAKHGGDIWDAVTGHDQIWAYLGYGPWTSRDDFLLWLKSRETLADPFYYAVVDQRSGKALGIITLMEIRPAFGVIEVGHIFFSPALQRTPMATEAIFLAACHIFDDLGYRRFEWKCDNGNEKSKRAAGRFGFTFEGLFRQHMITKGRNRDTAWFSMLDREWPLIKRAFTEWLNPKNFRYGDRQELSLSTIHARELFVGTLKLERATEAMRPEIETFQESAYARNRTILGVEPIPLKWDYGTIFTEAEVWVARDKDKLAGVLILRPREDDLYLESVATAPDMQGAGFGNALLNATEFRARDWGRHNIRLCTGERLTQNVDWYHRKGFRVEEVETMTDRNIIHMIKRVE